MFSAITLGIAVLGISSTAFAVPHYLSGHVTFIEASYMPNLIRFQIDSADFHCGGPGPGGNPNLYWDNTSGAGTADNIKAVYATLIAAYLSGRKVYPVWDEATVDARGAGNCVIKYFWFSE
jgi:hypothetical protein